jgi:acetylglutamate kinase
MSRETLHIIKVGGNIIDDPSRLQAFLAQFAAWQGPRILVHGGGKVATQLAKDIGIPQQMVDGRRITDKATLDIVTMVYAGLINKQVVASLQSLGCNAIGLSGADGDMVHAHKRRHATIDFGFVGDVDGVNAGLMETLVDKGLTLVMAPITHDGNGQLLNTNADTIAQEIARSMSARFHTVLVFSFEKPGVLLDAEDNSSLIPVINPAAYQELKTQGRIFAGMIPKLDNAFAALGAGVGKVVIGQAESLHALLRGETGTAIVP